MLEIHMPSLAKQSCKIYNESLIMHKTSGLLFVQKHSRNMYAKNAVVAEPVKLQCNACLKLWLNGLFKFLHWALLSPGPVHLICL